jgi:hypothetical protein
VKIALIKITSGDFNLISRVGRGLADFLLWLKTSLIMPLFLLRGLLLVNN